MAASGRGEQFHFFYCELVRQATAKFHEGTSTSGIGCGIENGRSAANETFSESRPNEAYCKAVEFEKQFAEDRN